jgi:AraC-like DNA-binding protein
MGHGVAAPEGELAFSFMTDECPARDRIEAIRGILGRGIWRFDFEPSPDVPFFGEGRMRVLPGLVLADITTSEGRTQRGSQHLVGDQFLFNVCLAGRGSVSQCGRQVAIGEGDAVLSTGAENAAMSFSASRFLSFRIPAKAIAALVPDADDRVARPIARDTAALNLLLGYARALRDSRTLSAPQVQQLAVTHVFDLVALTLGVTGEAGEMAKARGMRAARLRAIKADIEDRIWRENLSVAILATRHRLPVRYIRRLFEEDGTTFTEFVLSLRLAHARRALANPLLGHHKISMIAAESGFNNQSHFNETFRRRYGASPSDLRAQARRQH